MTLEEVALAVLSLVVGGVAVRAWLNARARQRANHNGTTTPIPKPGVETAPVADEARVIVNSRADAEREAIDDATTDPTDAGELADIADKRRRNRRLED